MLKKIFKIISFYDKIRWDVPLNYDVSNFFRSNLSEDTKLLTHWLCYISDRQMAFQRIWDIGAFVFSEMAENIKLRKNLKLLNPNYPNSFIKKNENGGYCFISNSFVKENNILKSYGFTSNDYVTFTPRYYPSDYFSILYTFYILQFFDFSLTKYIFEQFKKYQFYEDYIKRILFSLYLLSYFEIGQPSKLDISDFQKNISKAKKRTEKVFHILNNSFEKEYNSFSNQLIFNQKRAWCCLRDFLKFPDLVTEFKVSLKKEGITNKQLKKLFSLKSFQQLELPGDVWNNNPKFRNCILENSEYKFSKKSLNVILRDFFEKNKIKLENCYPKQFDITFDFVPRMCMNNNCDICPINFVKNSSNSNFLKTCVNDKSLFCSVALINCNYRTKCYGSQCELLKIINEK